MIFDSHDDTAINDSEREAVEQNARMRLQVCRRRVVYATGAFLLSCASVYPFLTGHRLHSYWESLGQFLLLLSLGLMLASLYSMLLLWGAWRLLRDLRSERV